MARSNARARRNTHHAGGHPILNGNTGAPSTSRRSTGYHGRNGRHATNVPRTPAGGSNVHGKQIGPLVLLLLATNMSTGAVNNETSTEPANSAFNTPVHRRMINSSPGPLPTPFSGSRLSQVVPEVQRRPSPMTPTGHESPGSFTTSPTPIRMVNIPKRNSVEEQYVLPSLVKSKPTVAKRATPRKRSNNWGSDDIAVLRRVSNPRLRAVLTSSRLPRPRQKAAGELPILRMSRSKESKRM